MIVKDGLNGNTIAVIDINNDKSVGRFTTSLNIQAGFYPIYLTYQGKGTFDFISIFFN
jgi:hypothetical protein